VPNGFHGIKKQMKIQTLQNKDCLVKVFEENLKNLYWDKKIERKVSMKSKFLFVEIR